MDVKVRCCPLDPNHPAADGSIILRSAVEDWLRSEDYERLIDGKLGLGSLTHRIRSIETASDSIGNVGMLKKTIGKDDLGLIVSPEAPTFTHYVSSFFIEDYKGIPWLCANLHIFSPDDGFDHIATENIKRLRALINNHIRLTVSLVVVAFWSSEPGSKCDIAKKIKTIKSCDFTVNPSFGADARIYEVTNDDGKIVESEKEFSIIEAQNYNDVVSKEGTIKVKTFSDISGFDLNNTPKTSKIDGKFTTLKVKEFSCFGEVSVLSNDISAEQSEQKEFTQAGVRDRLREAKLSPRMYFRRVYLSYSQVVKAMGGVSKIKESDLKILKSMFTSDILWILNQIQPEIVNKGKQINTLLGCSSISKSARQAAQQLQQPLRMAGIEVKKQGFLTKMRYAKLQDSYLEFIRSLQEGVFGPNPEPIQEESEDNDNEK